ncbi:hypothetical protein [Peribacillus frigoritolerans]|uniref:hypothetical protein n=1 Tax=Peribacillus frigoritolerans TaxID=450367 RepID=UPI003CFE5FD3
MKRHPDWGEPIFQVGAVAIDLDVALIDENETLDLATIRITDEQLSKISGTSYKEFFQPVQWPYENNLNSNDYITVVGFPGVHRYDSPGMSLFNITLATVPVMDSNDKTFYVEIKIGEALKLLGSENPEDLNTSLGGLSGGGVFISSEKSLDLVGIIKEDGGGFFKGIQATYSSLINKDGTINDKYDLL